MSALLRRNPPTSALVFNSCNRREEWLGLNHCQQPTPPPKSANHRFGFPHKSSFSSFSLPRHPSASSISVATSATARPSESFSIHSNESSRTLDSRKKPSLNPLTFIRKRSRSRLRSEPPPPEPVPPMPSPEVSFHPTPTTPPGSFSSKKPRKGKKPPYFSPPAPPPKESLYTLDTNLNEMDGIVDLSVLPAADSSSPGSGFESSYHSSSDVSSMQYGSVSTSQHSMFSNPFLPSSSQRRLGTSAPVYNERRISPKARIPGVYHGGSVGTGGTDTTDSKSWIPPESWAVEPEGEDPTAPYSSSDDEVRGKESSKGKKRRRTLGNKPMFQVRIYRANNSHHVVTCDLNVTVAQLTPQLNKKLLLDPGVEPHRLHLKERGLGMVNYTELLRRLITSCIERVLAPTERPADIVRRRLEQAGYDTADGLDLLGAEDIRFLLKFIYKSNVLGPLVRCFCAVVRTMI